MTPYDPAKPRGRLVQDPVTGRFHVEWSAVEKQDEPFNPLPIRFQKDDDGDDTAISGKKQSKDSLKRAKKNKRNRLLAEAAAEANRTNLNKGDEMKDPIIRVAKAMVENDYMPRTTTKKDFYETLVKLSGKRYPADKPATAFAKYVVDDENGRLLMKAHKMAPGADWRGDERPAATGGIPQPVNSSAYAELCGMAKSLSAERGVSFAKAFSQAYSANPELARMDRAHHAERVSKAMTGVR
jgi:hypothetical protein